ncbi:MAG: N-6 DNA methylase, partial [Acidimicrobiales bacterium]
FLRCEVDHVDGNHNALQRSSRIEWLKAPAPDGVCRILSNARCLSEGVDVPALDAVLFLNPRNSQVDVVQSVGRVMRRAPGKEYGYVILPVAIPSDLDPARALSDNKRYKVVWQVLQALRAHDDRFDAMVNQIELNRRDPDRVNVIGVGGGDGDETARGRHGDGNGGAAALSPADQSVTLALGYPLADWHAAILARIVARVGQRTYWEQWADDIRLIAEAHVARIRAVIAEPGTRRAAAFERFVAELRANLNPGVSEQDAVDMLAQHLITRPVFDALFGGEAFSSRNPVSVAMQAMADELEGESIEKEARPLEDFYASVRRRVEGLDNHEGRQKVVTELYERFFKKALPKTADAFGIVYTPTEIVDWILRATDQALARHLGTSLSAEGVHVLDPFCGTGTFLVRLLQSGLVRPGDLARKYRQELHANEVVLLAYYIAAVNVEAAFHRVHPGRYQPFEGMVLTDTFQSTERPGGFDAVLFPENHDRLARQQAAPIRVIVGNPPYSVGQTSQNDDNQNRRYPALDARIAATYARRSTVQNKNSLRDSYIRAIRWASDRIGPEGIVCFVSNGGWLDANSADGLRTCLAGEFDAVYVFNLRGNQRTAGEQSRREGGKVFGAG